MTEPKIVEYNNEELNSAAQDLIKKIARETGVLGQGTYDPVDEQGNLVDQRSIPVSEKFIIAINAQQVQDEREGKFKESRAMMDRLRIQFGSFVDENILRSPRTIFTGPMFPYHFAWFTDQKKYDGEMLGTKNMTDTDRQVLDGLSWEGYERADLRKLEKYYVTGVNAVLLQLPRHPIQLQTYRSKGMPLPPPLPPHLRDKFGTVVPATVQRDGALWVGNQALYVIPQAAWLEKTQDYSRRANGGSVHQFGGRVTLEPDSAAGVHDISLDNLGGNF